MSSKTVSYSDLGEMLQAVEDLAEAVISNTSIEDVKKQKEKIAELRAKYEKSDSESAPPAHSKKH